MASLRREDTSDEAPLLGERGDASLPGGRPLYHNFVLGTAVVAQAGAWIIAAIVWGSVFSNDLILFSAHPLLNSAGFLLLIQAILVVQPTHTAQQKKEGTYAHAALNDIGVLAAIAGLVVIEYNKISHNGTHFESAHARLGLVAYILVILQVLVGFTQYFTPGLYGGEANAKSLYKYHRVGGYITTVVMLATICAATYTTYNVNVMKIQLWAVVVASVLVVLGVAARVRLSKFGWMAGK
ncbi:uncharacterized protein SEPMUDRAFT_149312 [Sphaerulina musiva SO2202]|uniref:Cytochrome b561 domain-containing protein n=1 Tax=Sphaerulina musiva (strain SO2202) TaxID=692275 RepID=M3D4C0_SPHMS|nr:uncharacterized protein SEPMUDRAFT_149312 [Sphaerulina musiva SO2202]EMF12734.1 hypothetical protein SEPMUDRAFT_149312 [Sphaerulina musiva SO2202]